MKIIFKEENETLFGSTKILGIGRRNPKLLYGEKAKELREKANLTIDKLATEFGIRPNLLTKIENQSASLDEKTMNKYIDKFGVNKEFFFDLDLETLILSSNGNVLKSFETSEECKTAYKTIMDAYFKAVKNGKNLLVYFDTLEMEEVK